MSRNKWIVVILLSIVIIASIVYLQRGHKNEADVRIGVILPLTGRLSVIGEGERQGIELAIDSVRARFPGKAIQVVFEDFASETKNAVTAANKLIDIDHVQAIITSTTAAAEAVTPIIDSKKVIHFVISPDIQILQKSKFNYRIYYNFLTEAKVLQGFLDSLKPKSASFLAVKYSSIQLEIESAIEPFLIQNHVAVLSKDFFDISEKDFRSYLAKITSSKPNFVFVAPQVNQVELLGNQMLEAKVLSTTGTTWVGCFTFNWRPLEYLSRLEGLYLLSPRFQVADSTTILFRTVQNRFNKKPNFDMMYAYDNLIVLSDLLIKSDNDLGSFESLFNKLGTFQGASGTVKFVGGRDTDVDVVLTRIVNGKQIIFHH